MARAIRRLAGEIPVDLTALSTARLLILAVSLSGALWILALLAMRA